MTARMTVERVEEIDEQSKPLVRLYNDILHFINEQCAVLLQVAELRLAAAPSPSAPPNETQADADESDTVNRNREFHLLANVIWSEISARLIHDLSQHIFASGRTDMFHSV